MEEKIVMQSNGLPNTVTKKAGHQMFRRAKITDPTMIVYIQLPTKVCAQKSGRGLVIHAPKNTEFTFTHVSNFADEQAWYNRTMGLALGVAPPSAVVTTTPTTETADQEESIEDTAMTPIEMAEYIKENEEAMTVKEICNNLAISRSKYYKYKKLNEDA